MVGTENILDVEFEATQEAVERPAVPGAAQSDPLNGDAGAGEGATAADGSLVVDAPAAGSTVVIPVQLDQHIEVRFDLSGAQITDRNGDLVLSFPDGGTIVFEGFVDAAASSQAPTLVLPDGLLLPGDMVLALAADGDLSLEKAVGPKVATGSNALSGGDSVYDEDLGGTGDQGGSALAGLTRTGALGEGNLGSDLGTASDDEIDLAQTAVNEEATTTRAAGSQVTGAAGSQVTGAAGSQVTGAAGSQVTGAAGSQVTGADNNVAPEAIALDSVTVEEEAGGIVIGRLTVSDPDAGDSHSFTVDDGRFEVVDGELKLKDGVSLDYETEAEVTINVTATDTGGLSYTENFTITVLDIDEVARDPILTVQDASGDEDTAVNLEIAAALADPAGSETLSITIAGVPAGARLSAGAEIASGVWALSDGNLGSLTITPPADSSEDFTLTVTATSTGADGGIAQTVAPLFVTVAGVADIPALAVQDASGTQDTAISLDIAAALSDTDGSETLSITIADVPAGATLSAGSETAPGIWALSAGNLEGLTITPPAGGSGDFALSVTAKSTEAAGDMAETVATLSVTVEAVSGTPPADGNTAPTDISLSADTVPEDAVAGTIIGTLSAADADPDETFTYALIGGATELFAIVGDKLVLKAGAGLDFETASSHGITIQVTDGGGLAYMESFTIATEDVNEAPSDLDLSATNVAENSAAGKVVATVSVTDPDTADRASYALTDDAGGRFAIDADSGEITVADSTRLDHEAAASHAITVQVTDGGGLTYSESFTITVGDVNEVPTDLELGANRVLENSANGTKVGIVSATDPDAGDSATYALTDDADGRFAIDAETGELSVANGALLDYETASIHDLTVQVTDGGGLTYTESFTITVGDVNEAPVGPDPVGDVYLRPGDDVQAAINANPEGTVFVLTAGVYRQQKLVPKNNQEFIGEDGAILNGAMVLDGWVQQGDTWVIDGLPNPLALYVIPEPRWGSELAQAREDLFIDGVLYQRVGSLGDLGPGKWYYENNKAYVVDDPAGKLSELGVTSRAFFGGGAEGVVIENLTIEKYAVMVHHGAIEGRQGDGVGWQINNVTAQWNHAAGINAGTDFHINGGSFSNNGQLGILVPRDNVLIENVTVAYNNYAGFNQSTEAGGIKIGFGDGVIIRNSVVHDNIGRGIWADVHANDARIEGNYVYNNLRDGIFYEISSGGIINNNLAAFNGLGGDGWLSGSGILVQNSSLTKVFGNTVIVGPESGNGIGIVHQNRGKYITENNNIYDNAIIHLAAHGKNGVVSDTSFDPLVDGNNIFNENTYVLPDENFKYWKFDGNRSYSVSELEKFGVERDGLFIFTSNPEDYVPSSRHWAPKWLGAWWR